MTIWFTSDFHIGHANILKYCPNRPWANIRDMDEALIEEWAYKVAPADTVYFLGDLTLDRSPQISRSILNQLPGDIKIVTGNHDRGIRKMVSQEMVPDHVTVLGDSPVKIQCEGKNLVLWHYPIQEWPGMAHQGTAGEEESPLDGRWHLHGHSHGHAGYRAARLDVGWDTENRMLTWDDVKKIINVQYQAVLFQRSSQYAV